MLSPSSSRTYVRIAFLAFVAVLASLLTARYKLEAPHDRPYGKPVTLGHQAFQVAFSRTPIGDAGTAQVGNEDVETGMGGAADDGDRWDEDALTDWANW